jgi:hypothetical protein
MVKKERKQRTIKNQNKKEKIQSNTKKKAKMSDFFIKSQ